MNRKIVSLIVCFLIAAPLLFSQPTTETTSGYAIGISKMVSHPALDSIEQGIMDYLNGTDMKFSFDLQNCNGDIATAIAIAQKFKSDNKDLVIGIATPPAQALAQVITDKPVVFGAITDPLAAGLVINYDKTEDTNIAGISDLNPLKLQLETYFRIVKPKTLGMIYTSSEANGVAQMELAKTICADNNVTFVGAAVSNSSEVKMAAQSIVGRVDAMYVAIDNTVVSAIPSVSEVCMKAGIPLFNTDTTSSDGIDFLMSWGFNYYTVGVETGKVVERILRGEKPRDIGTVFFDDPAQFELWFNLDTAKKLNISIPEDLLDSAKVLVQNGKKTLRE
ncbi:MAG: ABC transporter substrate-binding protein [Sphaerochaeta sp.]|jgi:putative ABC transport system substrate-binding protein|uniref:ABC transporter substrate-binding protein n=1 Tax=unclassified Sphaerochaeta TaxID=2637943 RepID=UPI000A6678E8|nr:MULTISPECIES: ABC transporter substrate-binding protein [unclassified Sphaerochaeta]MCK9598700.1 ABC transporter substrate-binding protein [Sphaerochaeta sp.]MDX9823619.1 ABC transporter substrate-binding protein [Sphaerochaeta sp.]HPE93212.1 ABC transporter substrate-binding protein [Sphaerochaeta sp.]